MLPSRSSLSHPGSSGPHSFQLGPSCAGHTELRDHEDPLMEPCDGSVLTPPPGSFGSLCRPELPPSRFHPASLTSRLQKADCVLLDRGSSRRTAGLHPPPARTSGVPSWSLDSPEGSTSSEVDCSTGHWRRVAGSLPRSGAEEHRTAMPSRCCVRPSKNHKVFCYHIFTPLCQFHQLTFQVISDITN